MAKNLTFALKGTEYAAAPVKIERRKLYGWSEIIALDDEGAQCVPVSVDESGTLVILKGGTGIDILSLEGRWVDRSSIKAVDTEGKDAPLSPQVTTPHYAGQERRCPRAFGLYHHRLL